MARSRDLPLCLAPQIAVQGRWSGDAVEVSLDGADGPLSIRWQSQGEVQGEGGQVSWIPSSAEDQLDVVVRSADGVAIAELRLRDVQRG